MKKFGAVTLKHTKAGIPDPCITLRKGAPKELAGIFFNPLGVVDVEIGALAKSGKVKKKFAKKTPLKKFCLF